MWPRKKLKILVPRTPPDTPQGSVGAKKGPKCIPSSQLMIVKAKKATYGGSKILTYCFTRIVPKGVGGGEIVEAEKGGEFLLVVS